MTDVSQNSTPPVPNASSDEDRTMAIVVYALYLAAVLTAGICGVIGVIVAYIKRGEVRGTIWESHFDNQISAFWVWLALFIAGVATFWLFGLGFVLMGISFLWFLYRTIKGLIAAVEFRPYA